MYPRWQESLIRKGLKYRRVLVLAGPRQCGKTTLAQMLKTPEVIYYTLDHEDILQTALSDPGGLVKHGDELMIIDEIQRAPRLLLAIKQNVDENQKKGRFLLTGSANVQASPNTLESLAGRVKRVRLRPLAMGEIYGHPPRFLERAFAGEFVPLKKQDDVQYDKDWYIELAMQGGYPEARDIDDESEKRGWFKDYIDAIIERDLGDIANIRNTNSLKELVSVLAAWSSKFMDVAAVCSILGISRPAIENYIGALEALYLVEYVHPWHKTDYDRLGKQKKMFMSDTGMMAAVLGWRPEQVRLNGERSGKLIETFVCNQLLSILDAKGDEYKLYHYRDRQQREIDFLIEHMDGALLGVEVKAGSVVEPSMFKHISWFRDHLAKDRDFKGIILYTGSQVIRFEDDLWAVPIHCLWS